MKKYILILAAVSLVAVGAKAQGQFNFANFSAGVNAPIKETDGTTLLAGSAYKADYYWGAAGVSDPTALTPGLGAGVNFSGSGYFLGGNQAISGQSGTVTLQVRAWRASDGATWAIANATPNSHVGQGNLIQVALATGAQTVPNMVGLQGFNLTSGPEPATMALGLIGAGALFIRRRKA